MVALSMADGFARLTNKPQCVIVHVDVGTQALAAAVHNASVGRVPVLVFAGLAPYTIEGEHRGSRTEYIHWLQDVPDQKAIVAQYCRYSGEIKTGRNVKQIVNRALQFATSDPQGPVYLTGAREAMEEDLEPYELDQSVWRPVAPAPLSRAAIEEVSHHLVQAKEPLLIVGYTGRNVQAVTESVKLTEIVKGLRVLDSGGSHLNFPADHRASLGVRPGGNHNSVRTADFIIVVDCDVPWIPTQNRPRNDARIIHIDIDPLKRQMPVHYIPAFARYQADSAMAFAQINSHLSARPDYRKILSDGDHAERWKRLAEEHSQRLQEIASIGKLPSDRGSPLTTPIVAAEVRKACPSDTIWCIEAVTQTELVAEQIQACLPNAWSNCGAGGLGWSGGAALGLKLASEAQSGVRGRGKFVCQIVGDGTYLFSVPSSVYWISRRYEIPILTIVLNNNGWNAPKKSLLLVHPDGLGSKVSNEELNISFNPTPDYSGIAKAAGGGKLWADCAGSVGELMHLLPRAVQTVLNGTTAVLEVQLNGREGKYQDTKSVL